MGGGVPLEARRPGEQEASVQSGPNFTAHHYGKNRNNKLTAGSNPKKDWGDKPVKDHIFKKKKNENS